MFGVKQAVWTHNGGSGVIGVMREAGYSLQAKKTEKIQIPSTEHHPAPPDLN